MEKNERNVGMKRTHQLWIIIVGVIILEAKAAKEITYVYPYNNL